MVTLATNVGRAKDDYTWTPPCQTGNIGTLIRYQPITSTQPVDRSSEDGNLSVTTAAVPAKKAKWEGEDEEDKVASEWDESSDSDGVGKPAVTDLPASKKKGSLKQKLAEKAAERKRRLENGELEGEYLDMREKFMDEKEMRRIMQEKELEADMKNASDLFGATTIGPTSSSSKNKASSTTTPQVQLPSHLAPFLALPAKLTTKADFETLSRLIYANLIKPQTASSHYVAFAESHAKALCATLKEGETRKVANAVTGLAVEKAAAARAEKKKAGAAAVVSGKGMLVGEGGGKGKHDLTAYDEVLDDFGGDPDDFM